MDREQKGLLLAAEQSASMAYAPYSGFRVGAAVLTPGGIFAGANIETASTNLGICAERAAIVNARMNGQTDIIGIAVYGLDIDAEKGGFAGEYAAMPCGACRQWLAEFAGDAWVVISTSARVFKLSELLPFDFKLQKRSSN